MVLLTAKLLERIRHSDPTLTKLNLGTNNIGPDGARALADVLQTNSTLTKLNLWNNNIGPDGARALADVLQNNSTLTELHLYNNDIGSDGARAIAAALQNNSSLTELNLVGNNIGTDGACALAKALQNNSTLTNFYLASNNVGNDGARSIADALQNNSTLRVLDLEEADIGPDGVCALAVALKNYTTLTKLYLGSNDIDDDGARADGVQRCKLHVAVRVAHVFGVSRLALKRNAGRATDRPVLVDVRLATHLVERPQRIDLEGRVVGVVVKVDEALAAAELAAAARVEKVQDRQRALLVAAAVGPLVVARRVHDWLVEAAEQTDLFRQDRAVRLAHSVQNIVDVWADQRVERAADVAHVHDELRVPVGPNGVDLVQPCLAHVRAVAPGRRIKVEKVVVLVTDGGKRKGALLGEISRAGVGGENAGQRTFLDGLVLIGTSLNAVVAGDVVGRRTPSTQILCLCIVFTLLCKHTRGYTEAQNQSINPV